MRLVEVADEAIREVNRENALDVILGILNREDVATEDAGLPNLEKHDRRFHGGRF